MTSQRRVMRHMTFIILALSTIFTLPRTLLVSFPLTATRPLGPLRSPVIIPVGTSWQPRSSVNRLWRQTVSLPAILQRSLSSRRIRRLRQVPCRASLRPIPAREKKALMPVLYLQTPFAMVPVAENYVSFRQSPHRNRSITSIILRTMKIN